MENGSNHSLARLDKLTTGWLGRGKPRLSTPNRIAALDLGTNTFRALVADISETSAAKSRDREVVKSYRNPLDFPTSLHHELTPTRVIRYITRLGQDLHNRKSFHPDAVRRSLKALDRMQVEFQRLGVESASGICTAAFRSARNGPRLLAEIRRRFGWNVRIVSAREEASFAMRGILYGLGRSGRVRSRNREAVKSKRQPKRIATSQPHDLTTSRLLVIDIGGGSTEFIDYHGSLRGIRTTPLGVVRLTETHLKHDPPTASEVAELCAGIDREIGTLRFSRKPIRFDEFIGTAGTVTTLAALKLRLNKYDAARVTGTRITQHDLESLFQSLAAVPSKKRLARPGMEEGREDLILSGIQILLRTMRRFNLRSLVASDPGILEGIALSLVDK